VRWQVVGSRLLKTPTGVMEMYVSVFFVPGFIKQYRTLPYASYVKQ
jgi:hypothetical protein